MRSGFSNSRNERSFSGERLSWLFIETMWKIQIPWLPESARLLIGIGTVVMVFFDFLFVNLILCGGLWILDISSWSVQQLWRTLTDSEYQGQKQSNFIWNSPYYGDIKQCRVWQRAHFLPFGILAIFAFARENREFATINITRQKSINVKLATNYSTCVLPLLSFSPLLLQSRAEISLTLSLLLSPRLFVRRGLTARDLSAALSAPN